MMKKASLTAKQVTVVILLIVGFAIVAILYWKFISNTNIDRDACHESVVVRGTASYVTESSKEYVPLKCKTAKFCITNKFIGKGDCTEFKGETGVSKVRVTNKEQIEKFLAGEVVNCWSMLGEGKLSLFSQYRAETYGLGSVYPTCVICSRIAYDKKSLEDAGIDLSKINLLTYMTSHKVPDKSVSYFDYLAGEGKISVDAQQAVQSLEELEKEDSKIVQLNKDEKIEFQSYDKNDVNTGNEIGILFMQISAPKQGKSALNIGKVALGTAVASFITAPQLTIKAGKSIAKLCTSGGWVGPVVCASILIVAGVYQQANVGYYRALTASKCGDVSTGTEARNGCSVVRTIDYKTEDLSQYCSFVESIS